MNSTQLKNSHPWSFEESVDWKQRQPATMCSNLETKKNIQKLVDTVYERANTAMGE